MKTMIFLVLRSALLILATLASSVSQSRDYVGQNGASEPFSRPKIGLALSGGGARGAAHIGVLKVLEENRIPIDYVAGTSMGSIVGALYATGMTPDDIGGVIDSIDWDGVFSDPTPREERSYRRKRDDELYLVKSRPGIGRDGLKLPAGVVQGQKIDLVLKRFIDQVGHAADFDDFSIPFRAVATDIVTGEEVVLDSGSLAQAVRASMSVPAAFAPTEIDNRLLVDGGMANNMPISVVRDMGADVIIAVDISTPLLTRQDMQSVLAVTVQLTGFLTQRNTQAQLASLAADDILIQPDLGDITSADFERAAEAIPTGRIAAQNALARLQRLSLSPPEYAAYQATVAADAAPARQVDFIRIDNRSRVKDSIVAHRIRDTQVAQPLSVEALESDIGRVYGLELFQNVSYEIVEQDNQTGVEFSLRERSWGPTYVQLGAAYDSNGDGDSIFNLAVSTLSTGLNSSNGELRLGVQFGAEPGALVDYHQPLGSTGMWFANLRGSYGRSVITVFEESSPTANFELTEATVESSAGRELGTWGEARVGLRYTDGDADVRIGDRPSNPSFAFERGEVFASLAADELDSFFFPTKGYAAGLTWTGSRRDLGASTNYDQLNLSGVLTKSWGANTFIGVVDYQSTISGEASIEGLFRAGGLFNLSGLNRGELAGQHYARASLVYYRRIDRIKLLPMYLGATIEKGNVFQNRSDIGFDNALDAGSLFVGIDTFIGPIYAAYGAAEGSNEAVYVFLGRAF